MFKPFFWNKLPVPFLFHFELRIVHQPLLPADQVLFSFVHFALWTSFPWFSLRLFCSLAWPSLLVAAKENQVRKGHLIILLFTLLLPTSFWLYKYRGKVVLTRKSEILFLIDFSRFFYRSYLRKTKLALLGEYEVHLHSTPAILLWLYWKLFQVIGIRSYK